MSESIESRVTEKFRKSLSDEKLPEDMRVVYRVAGGMPHERLEHEFTLTGGGRSDVRMGDELRGIAPQEAYADLDQTEARDLLEQIGVSLDELVPRSEARFLPDSLVGSITIEVGGETAELFFLADEDQRIAAEEDRLPTEERAMAYERVDASPLTGAVKRINEVTERLLKGEEE
jgi:hypothetical protein